ncbi:hypothetical protein Vadar_019013 [Vaccinium darrowii]|uniref:Uncharacterized protein n=1 Tax=Vaccinium darrowii TaxID=229202 RepID=A0ACB7XSN7_9ERIC|nr:hypothetical protein Vadar_019013 [Vaccinium darrowii]
MRRVLWFGQWKLGYKEDKQVVNDSWKPSPPQPLASVHIYFIIVWVTFLSLDPVAASADDKYPPPSSSSDNAFKRAIIVVCVVVGVFLILGLLYWLRRYLVRRRSTLDPTVVDSFPMVMYPITSDVGFGATECHICLDEFTDGSWVKVLPQCRHIYHSDCIRNWLTSRQARCPDCSYDYSRRNRPADFLP